MDIRIGFGYDNHRLTEGRPLIIGGVTIPWEKGLDGHSDADILLHAVTDALLGAACLRDIGYHFNDKDPQWKGANSVIFVKEAFSMISRIGYRVSNLDCTLVAEAPKLNPHIPEMQRIIAELLNISENRVSIKAKTNEKLDAVGEGRGMTAFATVLIMKD